MTPREAEDLAGICAHMWRLDLPIGRYYAEKISQTIPADLQNSDIREILNKTPEQAYADNVKGLADPGFRKYEEWIQAYPERFHSLLSIDLPQSWRDHANLWPLETN